MTAYFRRLGESSFEPTEHVSGAWNLQEQHVAPVLGLLAHLVESDHARRRPEAPLVLARAAYDILGVIPMAEFSVEVRVVRPGRTIELVEAQLSQGGRAALTLRAWMLHSSDTSTIAGAVLPEPAPFDALPPWELAEVWPGGAVRSIQLRRESLAPGRARCWVRPLVSLLDTEAVSSRARLLGVVDFANGIATRLSPQQAFYPNVDLVASLFREPTGEWFALDTSVSFGAAGVGLTQTVLGDAAGALGSSEQTLTLRLP